MNGIAMTDNDAKEWGERTAAVHAGEAVDPVTRASSPNLVMSATFAPEEVTGFSARNRGNYEGFVYARVSNPTVRQLEDKLAALEGARGGAMLRFRHGGEPRGPRRPARPRRPSGDFRHQLRGNRRTGARHPAAFRHRGVAGRYRRCPMTWRAPSGPKRGWCGSKRRPIPSCASPTSAPSPSSPMAAACATSSVNSTFASPIATRPMELGADFVIHSLTKYIGGHGDAMGGAVLGRKIRSRRPQSRSDGALRRGAVAVQCLAHPQGRGHPAAAHAGARRDRPCGREVPRRPWRRQPRDLSGPSFPSAA